MKDKDIDDALMLKLENNKYYSLEDLSKELKFPRADIHKSFARLKMQSGWSITPSNSTAYWREKHITDDPKSQRSHPVENRGRKKGDVYNHSSSESDWERTYFYVRRP